MLLQVLDSGFYCVGFIATKQLNLQHLTDASAMQLTLGGSGVAMGPDRFALPGLQTISQSECFDGTGGHEACPLSRWNSFRAQPYPYQPWPQDFMDAIDIGFGPDAGSACSAGRLHLQLCD